MACSAQDGDSSRQRETQAGMAERGVAERAEDQGKRVGGRSTRPASPGFHYTSMMLIDGTDG